ncbi:hypothetical protein M413DRAFT_446718 [Hebeloma cylindrosporum]|uniref:Metal homeostatis protein bsd2 n=1 Tax=Hebeloma cylindrosporum TaxID=76867 RepID=A0A0C2YFG6_HEBCY|nr:hypothetical protein M413DRAFT_446718 [Hebeloma cylindrosporum h7]
MSARYAPLLNPRSAPDAERELEDAFDLDDEDEGHHANESTRLTSVVPRPQEASSRPETTAIPGAYDFEREYDFPPPGSPPPVGAILPTHYQRVPTDNHSTRPTGGGIENDGVFANVTAKPQAARVVRTEDGNVHLVPEDSQKETPPSYLEAQADAVPPYWETTIHAPAGLDPGSDMIIDDLPTGSFLIFCLNVFISFFFQFVGFLLTYLLHTSHAAKFGSRAGLGLTLIQYGFYSRTMSLGDDGQPDGTSGTGTEDSWAAALGGTDVHAPVPTAPNPTQADMMSSTSKDWLSFLFMTLGWFLLLSSVIGYWRVKRWEKSVRTPAPPPTVEQLERDRNVRRGLEDVFGITFEDNHQTTIHLDASGNAVRIPISEASSDARTRAQRT